MEVSRQVFDVFADCRHPELIYLFKREIGQSVDDVIKDLGCEAAAKDLARELKLRLAEIEDPETIEDEDEKMEL
jgi:hypothetical protein